MEVTLTSFALKYVASSGRNEERIMVCRSSCLCRQVTNMLFNVIVFCDFLCFFLNKGICHGVGVFIYILLFL